MLKSAANSGKTFLVNINTGMILPSLNLAKSCQVIFNEHTVNK